MNASRTGFNLPHIFGIAVAVGLVLLAGVIVLEAWVQTRLAQEHESKRVAPAVEEVEAYEAEQHALMHEYRWADKEAGIVVLPIQRAMELVVQENGGGRR